MKRAPPSTTTPSVPSLSWSQSTMLATVPISCVAAGPVSSPERISSTPKPTPVLRQRLIMST
jgi:hypothetical protein